MRDLFYWFERAEGRAALLRRGSRGFDVCPRCFRCFFRIGYVFWKYGRGVRSSVVMLWSIIAGLAHVADHLQNWGLKTYGSEILHIVMMYNTYPLRSQMVYSDIAIYLKATRSDILADMDLHGRDGKRQCNAKSIDLR
jgi:hypothetical protein